MKAEEAISILKTWRITGNKAQEALDMAISALQELKNSSDCVSRKSRLIDADALWMDIIHNMDYCDDILEIIERQPTIEPEQKWILCSERLPEEAYPVIVTWMNNDPKSYYQYILGKHYVGVAHYKNGKWFWYSSITEDVLMEYGRCDTEEFDEAIEVIAWAKLPDPYKEDADE